jgi:D-alanine-D-alanine ligase
LEEIKGMAETVYRALACRDLARMDFRLSPEGRPYFIEINPLPGLAPGYSDFPILADFCGMDYTTLIREILYGALSRYGIHYGSRG